MMASSTCGKTGDAQDQWPTDVGGLRSTAALADKIYCVHGKHWCDKARFSKNQLSKYHFRRASPKNSGISCREHTTEQVTELRCRGPCGRVRVLTCFSKNARSTRGSNWCVDCTQWQLSHEHGLSTFAPPGTKRSEEERLPVQLSGVDGHSTFLHGSAFGPTATGAGGDGGDGDDECGGGKEFDDRKTEMQSTWETDDGTEMSQPTNDSAFPELPTERDEGSPRGFGGDQGDGSQQGQQGQQDQGQGTPRPIYNAWGPAGERVSRTYAPTITSGMTGSAVTTVTQRPAEKKGWAKPPTRKTEYLVPDYLAEDDNYDEYYASDGSEDYC